MASLRSVDRLRRTTLLPACGVGAGLRWEDGDLGVGDLGVGDVDAGDGVRERGRRLCPRWLALLRLPPDERGRVEWERLLDLPRRALVDLRLRRLCAV